MLQKVSKVGMSMGIRSTGSMISVPAPLDKYGTRTRPHIRTGISIRVIHGYLDTNRYPRVPMDFYFFLYKKKFNF